MAQIRAPYRLSGRRGSNAGVLGALLLAAPHLGHSAELPFPPHTTTTAADFAFSVFVADVDGDGDTDVLSAGRCAASALSGWPGTGDFPSSPIGGSRTKLML